MRNEMDELLREALTPMDSPDERLNRQVLRKVKEREKMRRKTRIPAAAIVAACTLTFGSATVFAAYHYLTPDQAAAETGDEALEKAFLGQDAILVNETQETGGFRITLLGSVAGKNISDFLAWDDQGLRDERIYTLVAIEKADGSPMPDTGSGDYGKEAFFTSLYVRGLEPWKYNGASMGGGYSAFVKDGIEYRIMEMDNVQIFADQGIYVGVNSGALYDQDAFLFDESTGELTRNPDYTGVNALFTLPVDKSKADPQAAARCLQELERSFNTPSQPLEMAENDLAVEDFMSGLTGENIDRRARAVEATRQICTPDADGWFSWSYALENGDSASGSACVRDLFPSGQTGEPAIVGSSYSESGVDGLTMDVCILNEDGTVTFAMYEAVTQ